MDSTLYCIILYSTIQSSQQCVSDYVICDLVLLSCNIVIPASMQRFPSTVFVHTNQQVSVLSFWI